MANWHPRASKIEGEHAGPHAGGGRKIVWHTTEGSTAEGAIGAYRSHRGWPHFTLEYRDGRERLFQHLPLSRAARALEHPGGTPETNLANTIQVELVGFAKDTPNWPAGHYAAIAKLARWIEKNFKVPASCGVEFVPVGQKRRLSGRDFFDYRGHCGHQHAANQNKNEHTDPGKLRIELILGQHKYGSRALSPGASGDDVREFQAHLNRRLRARGLPLTDENGNYSERTDRACRTVTWYLGFPMDVVKRTGATPRVQQFIKDPDKRPALYRLRARGRKDKPVP
jgi:N-acetylmuramoyl-L-alanine amidase